MSTTACNLYRSIFTCHCRCPYAIITASHEHFSYRYLPVAILNVHPASPSPMHMRLSTHLHPPTPPGPSLQYTRRSIAATYLYHQRSPPWCCHILKFAMTEKVSSQSHSGRPWVGVAPVLLPSRWKYPSSIAYYLPTYSRCEHYRLAAYMRSRLGDPSRITSSMGDAGAGIQ